MEKKKLTLNISFSDVSSGIVSVWPAGRSGGVGGGWSRQRFCNNSRPRLPSILLHPNSSSRISPALLVQKGVGIIIWYRTF